jgi:hypothetical protein
MTAWMDAALYKDAGQMYTDIMRRDEKCLLLHA